MTQKNVAQLKLIHTFVHLYIYNGKGNNIDMLSCKIDVDIIKIILSK